MTASAPELLRPPAPDGSEIARFLDWLRRERGLAFDTYEELHRWSVEELEGFWSAVAEFYAVRFATPPERVLGRREMPGAEWFPGATLNYAEHVVGGGGSVRVPRLIGAHRMADMMLTGRVLDAQEGHALGLSHYLTGPGEGLPRALELAQKIAANSPVTNFAVLQALPRIVEANPTEGYLLESLVAALAGSSPQAQERMQTFLSGRGGKVQR